jgi:hypothetical protein
MANNYPHNMGNNPPNFIGDECHNQGKKLVQKKIHKQSVEQKISQEYSADIMGKALSSAEHYSSRFGNKKIKNMKYNYYNLFDSGIKKDKEELKKSIITFLDILQDYYQMDGNSFPSGIKINEVKVDLNRFKNNFDNKEDQQIYDYFIAILNGQRIDFQEFFNPKNAFIDPNKLANNGIKSLKSAGRQEKNWEKNVLEKGNYDVGLIIGKNWTDNPHFDNFRNPNNQKDDEDDDEDEKY